MSKIRSLGFGIGTAVLFFISLFLIVGLFRPKVAGINISTNPASKIIINGVEVGQAPYRDFFKPGKYVLRLIPEFSGSPHPTYDLEVSLEEGTETVIRRNFGPTTELSSGFVISFEKVSSRRPFLSVVSDPDKAQIYLNGEEKTQTPYSSSDLGAGDYELKVSKQGFSENSFGINLIDGYRLNALIKLEEKESGDSSFPDPIPTPQQAKLEDKGLGLVEVVDTPTGFLRIRSEASTLGAEVGRAVPGDQFVLLDVDARTGWFKIEYLDELDLSPKVGWVSNQYTKKTKL